MKLVFLGPPGAGKGTQAEKVVSQYGVAHISTGDMLRSAIAAKTEMGAKAAEYIQNGQLVPDDVVIGIVRERLAQDDLEKGFLLDGFPRTVTQAEALDTMTKLDAAILLDVDLEQLIARIAGRRVCRDCAATLHVSTLKGDRCPNCGGELIQRADDQEETVRARIDVYLKQTLPLVEYYKEKKLLRSVNGAGSVEEVFQSIQQVLKEFE